MRAQHAPTSETRAEVKALAAVGVREDEISKYVGIAPHTLRKHYRDELDKAHIQATASVARSLYKQATEGGSTAAAIFWMKARGGWREKHDVEISGPGGGPIPTVAIDPAQLSDAALRELLNARRRATTYAG